MLQATLLAVLGVTIGLTLTGTTMLLLPEAMSYAANGPRMTLFSVLLTLSVLIGGALSIRAITKIDPLIAVRG